jgi:autotransporter-associated beta strand protein
MPKKNRLRSARRLTGGLAASFAGVALLSSPAFAANLSWDQAGGGTLGGTGTWDTAATNWWNGTSDVAWSTNTVTGDTAVFAGAAGSPIVTLGANINALGLTFSTTGYTVALNGNTLALGTGGINATALTSGTTTISGAGGVGLAGNQTWDVGSGATLAVSSGISSSTTGTKILTVQGAGDTAISGAITAGSGVFNLNKRGTGTLTLSGGAVIGAGGISNGGATTLSAVLLGGTTKISSGTYTSAGEFVVGGVLANGGAGVDTNFTMDGGSLTITGFLSLGRGNGTGTVSSDIVLNNNASLTSTSFSAGFNAGNGGNLPKGTFTLNGTSSFTNNNGNFLVGESVGSNMTMTLNGSSTVSAGTGVIAIGVQSGNGTLNVNTGATFTSGGEIRVAYSGSNGGFTGTGTINVSGGTLNTRALTVGRNNNDVASTMSGTVNVTAGTLNVTDQTSLIGWRGIGTSGTVNISGGSYNQGTTGTANMVIGTANGVTGAVNVSGGALTLQRNSSLLFSNQAASTPNGTLTISGSGNVTFYSDAGSTVGGTGVVDLMNTNSTGTNTINLNGGTLTANQIKATSATGTRVINFNGGTLKVASSGLASSFLASGVATTANVRAGGAIIDTNGINTTIGQTLVHDSGLGSTADGGLTKQGLGTLTLSGANTYTGNTTINAGTLTLSSTGSTFFRITDSTNSEILGTGIGVFNGAFKLDLSSVTASNTWTLVSMSTLDVSTSYGGTFSVLDNAGSITFNNSSGVWTGIGVSGTYTFTQSTGVLTFTAVPEPHEFAIAIVALLGVMIFIRRRNQIN